MNYEFRKKYDNIKTFKIYPINQQEFTESNNQINFRINTRENMNFIDPKTIKFHFDLTKEEEQFPKQSLKQMIRGVRLTCPSKGFDFHKQLDDNLDVLSSINDFYFKGHQQTRTEVYENGSNDTINYTSIPSLDSNNTILNETNVKMYLDLSEIIPFFMSNQLIPIEYLEELELTLILNTADRLFLNSNTGYDLENVYISADFIKLEEKPTSYEFVNYTTNKVLSKNTYVNFNFNVNCDNLTGFILKSYEESNSLNYYPVSDSINAFNDNTSINAYLDGKNLYPQDIKSIRDFYNETKKYITSITNIKDYNSYYLYWTNMNLNNKNASFNQTGNNFLANKFILNLAFPINHEKVNNMKIHINNLIGTSYEKYFIVFPRFISKIDIENNKYIH